MPKYLFLTLLLVLTVLLTGCNSVQNQPETDELANKNAIENNVFNHQLFSFVSPIPFTTKVNNDGGWLKSKENDQFILEFSYKKTDNELDINQVIANEKANSQLMCEQTDACRKITNIEQIEIGGQQGIKVFYEADSQATNEILKWHTYFVYYKGNLYNFQPNGPTGEEALKTIDWK
jgi:ABC-type uncharacterized transport system auxiliary subunit